MDFLILITVATVSFFVGRKTVKAFTPMETEELKEMQEEARRAVQERTDKRKGKIVEFMKKEAVHQSQLQACGIETSREEFTRSDVEKLLDVSAGTARKYLNELEAEGKVAQIGERGPDVYYVLKK